MPINETVDMVAAAPLAPVNGRIAIVVPHVRLDTIPFLCDLSERLATRGYAVDIYGYEEAGPLRPSFSSDRIRLLPLPGVLGRPKVIDSSVPTTGHRKRVDSLRGMRALPGVAKAHRAARRLRASVAALDPIRRVSWPRTARVPYQVVIGVDPEGLVVGASLSQKSHSALVYYSLELLPTWDLSSIAERTLKWREARLSKAAALVVVQDPTRAGILAKDNGISPTRFVLAPNAPSGAARREPSRWWHEAFGLPVDCRVLLHAGSVGTWTGIDELLGAAGDLPDDWVLVVHSNRRPADAERVERLREIAPRGKVFFSHSAVSRQDYRALLDGADAGVVFYVPEPGRWTMTNITSIGLSSGKFAYYLWCGLPVIVNSATSLGGLVETEQLGIQIDSAAELGRAIRSVAADYQRFSDGALRFFNAELDFTASAERIGNAVDRLTRERTARSGPQSGRRTG